MPAKAEPNDDPERAQGGGMKEAAGGRRKAQYARLQLIAL